MLDWRYEDAVSKIERLGVKGLNREVAAYWLSLWRGGTPPMLASFDPLKLAPHLASIAMVEVRLRESEHCRAAGSNIRAAVGFDLTGKDMVTLTPAHQRRERMHLIEDVVLGSIALCHRPFLRADGSTDSVQEIALPFADMTEDGSLRYIAHTNWRPTEAERASDQVRSDVHLARRIRTESLA